MSRLIIELPEGMTQQEREELADALRDVRQEWKKENPSIGCYHPMPQRELNAVLKFEETLRQEPSTIPTEGEAHKNRAEFFSLMTEHPELPVVPMVDSEIVADDGYNRWLGSWGSSYIGFYLVGEEKVHFREDDDFEEVERVLTDGAIPCEDFEAMTDAEAEAAYASLPWIKAIIVNIDLPD